MQLTAPSIVPLRYLLLTLLGGSLAGCGAAGTPGTDEASGPLTRSSSAATEALSGAARAALGRLTGFALPPASSATAPLFSSEYVGDEHAVIATASSDAASPFTVRHVGGLGIFVRLLGCQPVRGERVDSEVVFPAAQESGADLVQRESADGIEDFLVMPGPLVEPRVTYDVALAGGVAGLRLVERTLEFLDSRGAPRLRVKPPWIADGAGRAHPVELHVHDCAFDTDARAPWGRPVTPPGASHCRVELDWSSAAAVVDYPAVLDPGWVNTNKSAVWHASVPLTRLLDGTALSAGTGKMINNMDFSTQAELFDANTRSWAATGRLGRGRYYHTATLLGDGRVLIAGGSGNGIDTTELYDPAKGSFAAGPALTSWRIRHTATTLLDGRVLLAGGIGLGGGMAVATADVYTPDAQLGKVAAVGKMPGARANHSALLLGDGRVLVVGGYTNENALYTQVATATLFDPMKNTFSAAASMAKARMSATLDSLGDGTALVVGGDDNNNDELASSEIYDPNKDQWSAGPSLATPRSRAGSINYENGRILILGGVNDNNYGIASVEVYYPRVKKFVPLPALKQGRFDIGFALVGIPPMPMVAGGYAAFDTQTAEVLDPSVPSVRGMPCDAAKECASGFCADGFCCNLACDGGCDRCDLFLNNQWGNCSPLAQRTPGQDPVCAPYLCNGAQGACPTTCAADADCAPGNACDGNKHCAPPLGDGSPCKLGKECLSMQCADGVCCNTACTGQCAACNTKSGPGICVPVVGVPQGARPSCASDGGVCGGSCDGVNPSACAYPDANVACRAASCGNGVGTAAAGCDAKGACAMVQTTPCAPYVCGVNACLARCMADGDCVMGDYCTAQGKCVPRLGGGSACGAANECVSGFCVDGVCCDSACAEQCAACNAVNARGTCTAVTGAPTGGRPPCASDGSVCGGRCDGRNLVACTYTGGMIACRAASCSGGVATMGAACDGKGACPMAVTAMCFPYVCGASACLARCAADADCVPGLYCDAMGQCVGRQDPGAKCTAGNQCASTFCADNHCCNSACGGGCDRCDLQGMAGICTVVAAGQDGADPSCAPYLCDGRSAACPASCAGDGECSPGAFCKMGRCQTRQPHGLACTREAECAGGFCVDGVCCESACADRCGACNVRGTLGRCVAVSGQPVGDRPRCGGSGACAGSCDGQDRAACAFPRADTVCAAAACVAGVAATESHCDGAGACIAGVITRCPSGCDGTNCATSAPTPGGRSSESGCTVVPGAAGGTLPGAVWLLLPLLLWGRRSAFGSRADGRETRRRPAGRMGQ